MRRSQDLVGRHLSTEARSLAKSAPATAGLSLPEDTVPEEDSLSSAS